jgi:hypothetical protein
MPACSFPGISLLYISFGQLRGVGAALGAGVGGVGVLVGLAVGADVGGVGVLVGLAVGAEVGLAVGGGLYDRITRTYPVDDGLKEL